MRIRMERGYVPQFVGQWLTYSGSGRKEALSGFEFPQQALNFRVAVHTRQAFVGIVGHQFDFRGSDRLGMMNAVFHAIERCARGVIAQRRLRSGSFTEGHAAAVTREQNITL